MPAWMVDWLRRLLSIRSPTRDWERAAQRPSLAAILQPPYSDGTPWSPEEAERRLQVQENADASGAHLYVPRSITGPMCPCRVGLPGATCRIHPSKPNQENRTMTEHPIAVAIHQPADLIVRDRLLIRWENRGPSETLIGYLVRNHPVVHPSAALAVQWAVREDDRDDLPPSLLNLTEHEARALHQALAERYGDAGEVGRLRQMAQDQNNRLHDTIAERDQARTDAMVQGSRAMGLEAELAVTRDLVGTVRAWHADTHRRLEQAETPLLPAEVGVVRGCQDHWDEHALGAGWHVSADYNARLDERDTALRQVMDVVERLDRVEAEQARERADWEQTRRNGLAQVNRLREARDAAQQEASEWKSACEAVQVRVAELEVQVERVTPTMWAVIAEREAHEDRGWTAEHDDQHGPQHLQGLVQRRLDKVDLHPRDVTVAASLLLAWLDADARHNAATPDAEPEPITLPVTVVDADVPGEDTHPVGATLIDWDGDGWTKVDDDLWSFDHGPSLRATMEQLVRDHGPLSAEPGV